MTFTSCTQGYYCPQGATAQVACTGLSTSLCPTGSKFEGGQSTSCTKGYYLSGSLCKFCDKGYVCYDNSQTSNPTDGTQGKICPVGYYCDPEISFTEIPCPAGTYNPNTEGKTIDDCLPAPLGFYQSATGQSTTIQCGTGGTTLATGSTQCSCKGKYRWWKSEANTCQCKKGYSSNPNKYEVFRTSGQYEDLDCGLNMCSPACGTGQFCNSEFKCESTDCKTSCPQGDGVFSSTTQSCSCSNDPQNATAACDTACQAAAATFYYDSSTSKFCCNFPCDSSNPVCKTATELGMYSGGGTISGNIPSMRAGSSGSYECPSTILAFKPTCYTSVYSRRALGSDDEHGKRNLQASASTYDQTIICLTSSVTTVTWQVSSTSFPVYNKDHPLNDDTSFDSSSFDTLKTKLISSGVSLNTFTYSFSGVSGETALVFNDYTSTSKITVVALNRASCPDGNVLPFNDETLKSVGISKASFLELTPMEEWLIVFPIMFCLIGVLFGVLVKFIEGKIEERRIAMARKQKEFIKEDGSEDRIEHLKNLYKIIQQCLNELDDPEIEKKLIEGDSNEYETNLQNEKADMINETINKFFNDFRFQDGEMVTDKAQNESTENSEDSKRKVNGSSTDPDAEGEEEEYYPDDYDDIHDLADQDSQEEFDPHLSDLLGEEPIEEQNEDDEDEGKDVEAILSIRKENERKRKEYEESLKRLGLSEEERRELMEKYEDSLRRAREMMEGDQEAQEKKRLQRLEERRKKREEGQRKMKELEENEKEIHKKYKDNLVDLDNAIEDRVANINDDVLKQEKKQKNELELRLKERLKKFKDNFYKKIKGKSGNNQKKLIAEHERENERLLKDLDRERVIQEKKLAKTREARRKKLVDEATQDLVETKDSVLREQADELEDVQRQKLLVAAQYGLEDDLYGKGVTKADEEEEEKRRLNNMKEIELMRLKQKHRLEKEMDDLIEDAYPQEQANFENMNTNINQEREAFQKRIDNASSESEKEKLLRELEEKEQEWTENLERQRQLQEQQLFEKKKRRELYRMRNKFRLDAKHRDEDLQKELELMEFEAFKKESEGFEKINELLEEKKGDKDLPLMVYKGLEEIVNRRLDDQSKKHFYELSGKLSNLYTNIAFDKALARKNLEEDMNDKVKELDSRNAPSQEFQKEINRFQKELDRKGKQQEQDLIRKQMEEEMTLREQLKEKNYDEKRGLEEDLDKKKEEILKKLSKDFRNEDILKLLMARSREELDERLLKIAEDKENDIQKIKFKLVAKNKKDLAEMEKRLEEDLAKAKRQEEINFEKKKKKMLKDLKSKYMEGLKNRENLTKDQKDMLLKRHEDEISRFEIALAKEKERQFTRMREKLILKRLEAEKEKEHKRREARINRQLREDDEDEDESRRRRRKGRGKHDNLLSQLTDVMSERMESQYDKSSVIPRRHGVNLNVMLRGLKDSILDRQQNDKKFDPTLYLKFKGDDNDEEFEFQRLQTDAVSMKSTVTEPDASRLLRRIIRVEKISSKINENKILPRMYKKTH
eukprot:CAMPEP_0197016988 /NCGR_PEP_ID=MMETSP1380-20130617/79288_1 /TAXON_ID=5936 /ORGANISM="Euplotes crassus, Strain CT5" /LENGTH=1521 /DNA_ID=CAMNT_0042444029 /DNA_START=1979 /DNA_END=6544 /DNA_ORIENTATION=-